MMLVCIVLRIRDIDVAWLSRFLRFSAEGFVSSGGVTVLSHLINCKNDFRGGGYFQIYSLQFSFFHWHLCMKEK